MCFYLFEKLTFSFTDFLYFSSIIYYIPVGEEFGIDSVRWFWPRVCHKAAVRWWWRLESPLSLLHALVW